MSGAQDRFGELMAAGSFDLAEACLLVARDAYPGLDVDVQLARIEDIAATIRGRLAADAFPEQKVRALNFHLFSDLLFLGNIDDYYDPRNSYLNEVLDRRTGIPITLSILYMEVGRRIGLNLQGVSFPGHFLVRLALRRGQLVLDPFLCGESLSEAELRLRLEKVLPPEQARTDPLDAYIKPAAPRQIIARLLRKLKAIYAKTGQLERALDVQNRMVAAQPGAADELRDRGLLYQKLECFRPALSDLQAYLARKPDAADAADMRLHVAELQQAAARLN